MESNILGWGLIVVGFLFLILGLAAAARDVIKESFQKNSSQESAVEKSVLEVLVNLINALAKAPKWLALTVVGIVLIVLGSSWAF